MASTNTKHRRTTVGDLIAAAKVGAVDPSTEVLTAEDAEALRAEGAANVAQIIATAPANPDRSIGATDHECAIPGCRHGAAHGPTQPDRQVKLQCTACGAIARMTARALAASGGINDQHGAFVAATRRVYTRKAQ